MRGLRRVALMILAAASTVAAGVRAADAPAIERWPVAPGRSGMTGGWTLVTSPTPGAAALSACAAPFGPTSLSQSDSIELAKRGGKETAEDIEGVDVWCASLPPSELSFALWLLRKQSRAQEAHLAADGVRLAPRASARAASLVRIRAVSLEGATGVRDLAPDAPQVLVLTGKVDSSEVARLARGYLAGGADLPPHRPPPWTLHQSSERLSVMESELGAPVVRYGWAVPDTSDDEQAALSAALEILGGSAGARLPRLFEQRGLARHAEAWSFGFGGGTLIGMWIELSTRTSVDRARRFLDGALKQLRLVGPSKRELDRARLRLRQAALLAWEDPLIRAQTLAWYEVVRGSATRWIDEIHALEAVTASAVRQVVRERFIDGRRATVEVYRCTRSGRPIRFPPSRADFT